MKMFIEFDVDTELDLEKFMITPIHHQEFPSSYLLEKICSSVSKKYTRNYWATVFKIKFYYIVTKYRKPVILIDVKITFLLIYVFFLSFSYAKIKLSIISSAKDTKYMNKKFKLKVCIDIHRFSLSVFNWSFSINDWTFSFESNHVHIHQLI